MSSRDSIPDAWDDDYENVVDSKPAAKTTSNPVPQVPQPRISRAQRKAQHEEANKQLWDSAENPETFHFVEAKNNVPLNSDFKPALKVLSRKPQTTTPSPGNVASGVQGMSLQDEDDDSEEEARKAEAKSIAERREVAAREREEKQKKYAQVRERLFGSTSPARQECSDSPPRGVSGRITPRGSKKKSDGVTSLGNLPTPSADQSPARVSAPSRHLYDPNEPSTPRPSTMERSIQNPNKSNERPIRSPRGPDGSGRNGFGFAPRGNKTNAG